MTLTLLDREAGLQVLRTSMDVEPSAEEGIAELLRGEVHARGTAPRAATLDRVRRMVAPAYDLDVDLIEATCVALVLAGDIVLAPNGTLAATPIRVVRLPGDQGRILASLPTRALQEAVGVPIEVRGLVRRVGLSEGLETRVKGLGGIMLTPEQWAGLDRAQKADADFLQRFDERLEWGAVAAGSLDREGALVWMGWTLHEGVMTWRREVTDAVLWQARQPRSGFVRAWTRPGGPPAIQPFIALTDDEANRARFAFAARMEHPLVLKVRPLSDGIALETPGWLPRAEYRWLSLHAERQRAEKGPGTWHVPAAQREPVIEILRQRLGVVVEAV